MSVQTYIIKADPKIPKDDADYFFHRVQEILNSKPGWRSYTFKYVGPSDYNNPESTPPTSSYNTIVVLIDRDTKHKLLEQSGAKLNDQPEKDGFGKDIDFKKTEFSYTFHTIPIVIVIDYINWKEAFKPLGITAKDYEKYVIFHEFGHSIGKNHKPIPLDPKLPYPIMYQATLGLPDVKRFVSHPNASDDQN